MARFALIVASTLGFFLTAAVGNLLVPLLRALDRPAARGPVKGPVWQPTQRGVPTMGGLCFIVGTLAAVGVAWSGLCLLLPDLLGDERHSMTMLLLGLGGAFLFGAVGFADDLIKIRRRQVLGMRRGCRLALECAAALLFVLLARGSGCLPSGAVLPFAGYTELGMGGYLLWMLLAVALAESARLTDSADGVCAGVAFVAMLGLMSAATLLNYFEIALLPAALAGALMAFLLWNFAPSKILNGATGSLFLAGALGCIPMAIGWPMLAVLLGLPYLAEGGTVLAQAAYYRFSGGKLLFAAAPLHRWLKVKKEWSDVTVCYAFCALALFSVLLTLVFVRLS